MEKDKAFVLWFNELGIEDVPYVGGKNASLGEMYRNLTKKGIRIPNGFAVTASAYRHLIEKAGIKDSIKDILSDLNTSNMSVLPEQSCPTRDRSLIAARDRPAFARARLPRTRHRRQGGASQAAGCGVG